jgi:hypothetical protein
LAGRPGSWEAAKVEDLLYATVGSDQADLWQHRTEPVQLDVDVDELLSTRTEAWSQYDDAEQLIYAQQIAAEKADPEPDQDTYGWVYNVTGPNQLTAVDAAAPEWSWESWRALQDKDFADHVEGVIRDDGTSFTSLFIPHSPEAATENNRL